MRCGGASGLLRSLVLALTCILEALCVAIPFALGDQLAVLAGGLREWGTLGFGGLVLSWSVVVGIVVLPTAIVAGYQFPLLIALLGPGARQLGLDVGWTYAWNTLGAILGALLGGFVLLPWLSAPGAWQLVVVLLAVLGGGIAAFAWVSSRREGESANGLDCRRGWLSFWPWSPRPYCWRPDPPRRGGTLRLGRG